jgi:hypothetical protein
VPNPPEDPSEGPDPGPIEAAARFAGLGRGALPCTDADLADAEATLTRSDDPRPRQAALGALVRLGGRDRAAAAWAVAVADPDPRVRRRAAELAPQVDHSSPAPLRALLADADPLVAEAAAAAAGEIAWAPAAERAAVVAALAVATREHPDPLVREASVAALGALGDPAGLPSILAACSDRAPIRRRAVLALAPFDGPDVDAALADALTDADWQVRQAAEDLR